MIKIISFGSGSDGNCAIAKNDDTIVMIDCGIQYERVIKGLRLNKIIISDIDAVLFTHYHRDHTNCLNHIYEYELPIYATKQAINELSIKANEIVENRVVKIGSMGILPIKVNHGNAECYAFILHDKDSLILWATDFLTFEKDISSLPFTEIYIETNYINEYMENMMAKDENNIMKLKRQISTHTSLENSIMWLKQMNLTKCKKIVGIHLSSHLSNANIIKNKLYNTFNIPSYCLNWKGEEE